MEHRIKIIIVDHEGREIILDVSEELDVVGYGELVPEPRGAATFKVKDSYEEGFMARFSVTPNEGDILAVEADDAIHKKGLILDGE